MTEEEWQAKKTKFDLADREKSLLKDDDELSYIINDTEIQIKTLANTLKVTLSERDRVRHELIIVRIKLLH